MLITGLGVLALVFFRDELNAMGSDVNFELVLPLAMREFVPTGLLGLLIAALLAAFMSTYAATVNAAPAYIVNDVYKRYLNPTASQQTYVRMSYATSLLVVLVGTGVGFFVHSLNAIIDWIVAALYGSYTAANVLKWYWWRLNGYGYFWGMLTGIAAAMIVPSLVPDVNPLYSFPIILAVSLVGCIAGSLATDPDDEQVLERFYLRVRPWGFWGPVHARLLAKRPGLAANRDFGRDMLNVAVGIAWQTGLTTIGIFLVIQDWTRLLASLGVVALATVFLKLRWYDRLRDEPEDAVAPAAAG
jgi:Na+/proline symporter